LSREIKKRSEVLKSQKIAGQLEHPTTGIYTRLDKVAHILADVDYDQTTKLASAKSYILDTTKGKDFLTLLKSGLSVGASMRGIGQVKDGVVQDDYSFDTVDFVLKPSFGADARIDASNLIESANELLGKSEEPEDPQKAALIRVYTESINAGFKGSFTEWKEKYPKIVTEVLSRKSALTGDEKIQSEAKRIFEGLKTGNPNSSTTLESVVDMLIKEREKKGSKALRRKAISRVARSISDAHAFMPEEKVQKLIEVEYQALKSEVKAKNQAIFLKILSDSKTK